MASTQKKKNGHHYVRYRDLSGVQRTTAAPSHQEAEELARQIEEWLADGIDPNRAMATFKQVAEAFFEQYVIPNCTWKTTRDYTSAFECYHLKRWSRTPIRTITKHEYKRARDAIKDADISPKRVNNVMVPLRRMFRWAKEEGYILSSPAEDLRPLPTTQEEMRFFTPEQLNEVVAACDMYEGFYRPHILFLGWTGLRVGELQELRFKDIRWEYGRPKIHVQRALKDGINLVGLPKSGKKRWVGVPAHIVEVLRQQEDAYKVDEESLVFPSLMGGYLDQANLRNRVFYPALVNLGWREPDPPKVPHKKGEGARKGRGYCTPKKPKPSEGERDFRIHDLRHTFAYIFLNRGRHGASEGDLYALKETMGHAQIQTTMRYAHFAEEDSNRVSDALDEAWKNTKSAQNTT